MQALCFAVSVISARAAVAFGEITQATASFASQSSARLASNANTEETFVQPAIHAHAVPICVTAM